jgi:hypothetical protein
MISASDWISGCMSFCQPCTRRRCSSTCFLMIALESLMCGASLYLHTFLTTWWKGSRGANFVPLCGSRRGWEGARTMSALCVLCGGATTRLLCSAPHGRRSFSFLAFYCCVPCSRERAHSLFLYTLFAFIHSGFIKLELGDLFWL